LAAEGAGAQPTIGTPVAPRVPGRLAPAVRGIAVDARLATDAGVRVGDTLRLSAEAGRAGELVVVEALVERGADPSEVARSEYRVRLHLDHLQRLIGAEDRVDRFAVAAREDAGPDAVDSLLAGINHVAFGFRAHASRDVAVQSSRTFQVVDRFHRAIGGITIVASAVFLLCILLLKVEERRRAVAALRLAGLSRRSVALSVMAEAAVVAVLGSVTGAAIGWVATLLVNAHYQRVFRTPLTFAVLTPQIALFAVTLSLALGVVAGALAAWRLVRTPPLTLLGR
ncbi:MAG TPA: ABC transporter permease, partial [Gemmatimonadaceae bacterium]|nr:ABC transporter permease [Gemmatimonadaceae bacterium]